MSGGDMREEGDDARRSSRPSHSGASGRSSAVIRIMNLLRPISPMLCVPLATGPSATIVSKMGEASHATMWSKSPSAEGSGSPLRVRMPS